jgi:hypothetical protein
LVKDDKSPDRWLDIGSQFAPVRLVHRPGDLSKEIVSEKALAHEQRTPQHCRHPLVGCKGNNSSVANSNCTNDAGMSNGHGDSRTMSNADSPRHFDLESA